MAHANARLTVHGRRLIIERARAGWKQAHIAAAMGVSRRCVKRWIERYRADCFFRDALGLCTVPSSPTLRQRLDALGRLVGEHREP